MVKSGLVDNPHVSQYRLTAHFGLAIIIYAYLFWVALDLLFPKTNPISSGDIQQIRTFSWTVTGLIFITALSGGLKPGLKPVSSTILFP